MSEIAEGQSSYQTMMDYIWGLTRELYWEPAVKEAEAFIATQPVKEQERLEKSLLFLSYKTSPGFVGKLTQPATRAISTSVLGLRTVVKDFSYGNQSIEHANINKNDRNRKT